MLTVPITGTATDPTVWLELDDEENDEEADDSILAASIQLEWNR